MEGGSGIMDMIGLLPARNATKAMLAAVAKINAGYVQWSQERHPTLDRA